MLWTSCPQHLFLFAKDRPMALKYDKGVIIMKDIPNLFASSVFNDEVMRAKLPKDIYRALKKTISRGTHLELDVDRKSVV